MKLNINFNPFKKKEARQEERSYNFLSDSLFYNSATTYSESKAMLLSAVYRCVDVISDSVAQLPLEPYSTNYFKFYVNLFIFRQFKH